ncbi:MAG: hypothetical protein WBM53_05445 [Maribacter sp.]
MKVIQQKTKKSKIALVIVLISLIVIITLQLGYWFGKELYHLGF